MDRHAMNDNGAVPDADASKAAPVSARELWEQLVNWPHYPVMQEIKRRGGALAAEYDAALENWQWEVARLRGELEREKAAADTVRRSNAGMLEEIDRWQGDAERLRNFIPPHDSHCRHGPAPDTCECGMAQTLAAHDALAKEAGEGGGRRRRANEP